MRNEIKIPINKDFFSHFNNWKDFEKKISNPYKDRLINSIYFDDENFATAQDNLSGISDRRKYRIRWYGNNFKDFSYEVKIKKNNLGRKIALKSKKYSSNLENLFLLIMIFLKKKKISFF